MTPSRRTLLGGLAGATLARGCVPIPAMAEGPDAELIRLCVRAKALRVEMNRLFDGVMGLSFAEAQAQARARAREPETDAAADAYFEAAAAIVPHRAATAAGVRAKAAALHDLLDERFGFADGQFMADGDHTHLALSLTRDVLALGA